MPGIMVNNCNPGTQKVEEGDQNFEVNLGYTILSQKEKKTVNKYKAAGQGSASAFNLSSRETEADRSLEFKHTWSTK